MRKTLNFTVLISIVVLLSFQTHIKPTNSELKTTCIVLSKLTSQAIDKQRNDLVTLYYNAYQAMREEINFQDNCDSYFNDIKTNFGSRFGTWRIHSEFPPKLVESTIGRGTFTHKEVEFLERLKSYGLFETDFSDILLFMDIKRGQISIENIKNINVNEWNNTINKIKDLQLDKIELKKLEELNRPIYNINDFKQNIHRR